MNPKRLERQPKYLRSDLVPAATASRVQISRRRSNRMVLNASVALSGEDRLKCQFSMPAKATNLNRHGAVVRLSRDLVVGSVIFVRNQRNVQVSARVVSVLTATKGNSTYGIEFVDHDERAHTFWGITFPPNA
jgi:D-alanyl-D-alanine carboxypeptidase